MSRAPTRTLRVFKYAMYFNGVNDYVDCGNPPVLDFATEDFTVEVWAKSFGGVFGRGVVNKGGWGTPGYSISEAYVPPDRYYFAVRDATTYRHVALPLTAIWDWKHVVGIKKTNYLEAWVNRARVGTLSATIGSLSNPAKSFEVGRSFDKYYFYGLICAVRVYSRALSAEEVAHNYSNPGNPARSGLVLWLQAHPDNVKDVDGDGRLEWLDLSGYNNHAKLYGATLVEVVKSPARVLSPARVVPTV